MKRHLLLLCLTCLVALPSAAQITITRADLESQFDGAVTFTTRTASDAQGAGDIAAATGANQTWDFTVFTYEDLDSTYLIEPVELPAPGSDDEHFAQANVVLKATIDPLDPDSVIYQYITLSDDALVWLGFYAEAGETTASLKFEPGFTALQLPLTADTEWTYTGEQVITFDDQLFFSMDITENQEVVGWGTLIVPGLQGGTVTEAALMVRDTTITVVDLGIPGFEPEPDTSVSVTFYTESGVTANIFLDDDGLAEDVSYTIVAEGAVPNEPEDVLPQRVTLHQNHPNPFNPETTIRYDLAEPAQVTLRIYDAAGRRVAALNPGQQAAGPHEVRWNAVDQSGLPLPSGVYLYRLEAVGPDDHVSTSARTMVLVK